MIFPNFTDYLTFSQNHGLVPVYTQFLADTDTPITIFLKLAQQGASCLLESAENGQQVGRYSFIATDPFLTFRYQGGRGQAAYPDGVVEILDGEPLSLLNQLLADYQAAPLPIAAPFYGGAVGYWGYELAHVMGSKDAAKQISQRSSPKPVPGDLEVPDCHLFFPGTVAIFDHLKHTVTLVVNLPLGRQEPQYMYQKAQAKLQQLQQALAKPLPKPSSFALHGPVQADLSTPEFTRRLEQAIADLKAEKVQQVVLSRRYAQSFSGDDFAIYRQLRSVNPSPYMYYLRLGETKIIGSSPEMLVQVQNRRVTTCPIAGTRRRGQSPQQDQVLAEELLADPKERIEHQMLVDNSIEDLQKFCQPHTVLATRLCEVQYFSHVMHLVSRVEGDLAPGVTALDALAASFPAGTVSGAPRDIAMDMIKQLEPYPRGVYAGAVGYVGFGDNLDTAIAIRTLVVQGNTVYIQAGAGIVAQSVPRRECEEMEEKAQAMFEALGTCDQTEKTLPS